MFHLAQANIARFKAPLHHPSMKEFVNFLEPVNKFAEESKGFVWRLTDDYNRSASYIESPFQDEMMAINVSVWENMEYFKTFVYSSVHSYFLKNKKKWFDLSKPSQFVMWWIPVGEIPTLDIVKGKLEHHVAHGDSPEVFSMRSLFDINGKPIKTL
jgi:hypothetical protein